jgi:site-specific recombinase XerD
LLRSADARTLIPAQPEAPVLRFQTLESLDARFQDFLWHARVVLRHSEDSLRGYKGTFGNFRQFLVAHGDRPLPERLCDIDGWIAWNRARRSAGGTALSGVTVNTYFRQLRPFFHDLEERDGVSNPFRTIRPPRVPKVLPKARTFEECQHILATAEHLSWQSDYERRRATAILATFLYAGLRKGELLRLRFNDVRFEGGGTLLVTDRKTSTERIVPMAPDLAPILAAYVRTRAQVFRGEAGPGFFTSLTTGQTISDTTLRRIVTRVRRGSGVPFSMHSLRHSFVTTLLNSNAQIHVVQALAGHAKITTTAMYLRVTGPDKEREIQKLSFRARAGAPLRATSRATGSAPPGTGRCRQMPDES